MARILVIDDDEELRQVVCMALESAGYETAQAEDGTQGVQMYRSEPSELVICDIFMPGKDGLETIRELKAFNGAKIIAMSGGSSQIADDFLPVARQFGARRVLWKPFDIKTLLKLTSELLAE
jgi:two-component system, chemotaxis family, chemotaxis protein CheY